MPRHNPLIGQLLKLLPLRADCDGCQYGMKAGSLPMLKPWRSQTDCPATCRTMSRRCSGGYRHGRGQGRACYLSGFYSLQFSRSLYQGYMSIPRSDWAPPSEVLVGDADAASSATRDTNVRALMSSIRKLHVALGHPDPRRLARSIQLSGGTAEAVAAALSYRCETCQRMKTPPPTQASSIANTNLEFGDRVGIDLFSLGDIAGQSRTFVNIIDWGTGYQVVSPCASKRPDVVFAAFLAAWVTALGVPAQVITDRGGEFEAEFARGLEWIGSKQIPTPAYAPTQNSITERAGGSWKLQCKTMIEDQGLRWDSQEGIEWWVCAAINFSRNQQINERGYSPSQWVLGRGLRLPAD